MYQLPADTSAQSVFDSFYSTASHADTAASTDDTDAYPAFSDMLYDQMG